MAGAMEIITSRINPRLVISISVVLTLLVPLAFLAQFLVAAVGPGASSTAETPATPGNKIVTVSDIPPLTQYQEAVRARELFGAPVEEQKIEVKKVGIADLAKNYELTGIVSLDKMEAIINDRRSRQSYFVNEGSALGEMVVEKIESDKVILSYQDEKHELHIV